MFAGINLSANVFGAATGLTLILVGGLSEEPAGCPEPTETQVLEDGHFYFTTPYFYDFSEEPAFEGAYPFVRWFADARFISDDIVDGRQEFRFYKSLEDMNAGSDVFCVMPETFLGVRNDGKLTPGCSNCQGAWEMTFSPVEAQTTCDDATVAFWNNPTDPWADWHDVWGFTSTEDGYPLDWGSLVDYLEEVGTEWVVYAEYFGSAARWGAEYAVVPYCNVFPEDC